MSRLFILVAALFGIAGVALAAASTHMAAPFLGTASQMLLFHAPVLIALGLFGRFAGAGRAFVAGGVVLTVGTMLFSGDLVMRHFVGQSLFPMAAPTGGMSMMAGWLILGIAALLPRGRAMD
ncbi:DUF423 domain-containing protein [Terrihabitans sp. B22-R8]|uniref:DUF423 domain-containing protein n=1 Tax=Terrihabitans sp. B22-R8 TaxID=3425128 RepID=UPI00403D1228